MMPIELSNLWPIAGAALLLNKTANIDKDRNTVQ
jgi:hypothetical protein